MIKIFVYILLIKIFYSNIQGCLSAKNSQCLICDQTKYSLVQGKCEMNTIKNCSLYNSSNQCQICEKNYFLRLNKKCRIYPNPPLDNCEFYTEVNYCKICKSGFFSNKGKCEQIKLKTENCLKYDSQIGCFICEKEYYLTSTKVCEKINPIQNCLYYNAPFTCKKCAKYYHLNNSLFLKSIVNFYPLIMERYFENKNNFQNSQILNMPHCERQIEIMFCSKYENSHSCKECQEGYFLSSPTKCELNPITYWTSLDSKVENCIKFDFTNTCYLCQNGFFIDENSTCSPHSIKIENCYIYSPSKNNDCFICNYNFFITENDGKKLCSERTNKISNCKQYSINTDTCVECIDGFIKHSNSTKCSQKIDRCEIYNNSQELLNCEICEDGFELNNGICIPGDQKCSKFDNNQCIQCNIGYAFNENNTCIKLTNSQNKYHCKKFNVNLNICSECFDFEIKQQLVANCEKGDSNCDFFNTNGTCFYCKKGFKVNNGNCVENTIDPNCSLFHMEKGCQRCVLDYYLDKDGKCQKINIVNNQQFSQDCLSSQNDYKCDFCLPGYVSISKISREFQENITCSNPTIITQIITNCLVWDKNNSKCLLCDQSSINKYLSEDGTSCVSNCSQKLNIEKMQCENDIDCKIGNEQSCFKCPSSYFTIFQENFSLIQIKENLQINSSLKNYEKQFYQAVECQQPGLTQASRYDKFFGFDFNTQWQFITKAQYSSSSITLSYEQFTSCNQTIKFQLPEDQLYYQDILTCHQCTSNSEVIVLDFKSVDVILEGTIANQGTLNENLVQIQSCKNTTTITNSILNCGVYEKNSYLDEEICVLCKPSYKPIFTNDQISQCQLISNCASSTLFSGCSECQQGSSFPYIWYDQKIDYSDCVTQSSEAHCFAFDFNLNNCYECKNGYYLNNANQCIEQTDSTFPNCQNGIGGQYCTICNKDTIQNTTVIEQTSKNECVPQFISEVENNCLIMNKDFECIACPFSYVYKDKKCYPSTIISNCVQAINNNGTIQCEQCQLGYLLSANKLQCDLQTLQNQYLIRYCVEYKDSENCQKCDFGYGLIKAFDKNRNKVIQVCSSDVLPTDCLIVNFEELINNRIICVKCVQGYKQKILSNADQQNYCSYTLGTTNCLQTQGAACVQCDQNYYINGNFCRERTNFSDSCQKYFLDEDNCEKTISNPEPTVNQEFYLSKEIEQNLSKAELDLIKILPLTRDGYGDGIPECAIYLSRNQCKNCNSLYYPKDDKTKCLPVTNSVQNCLYYLGGQTCEICREGYLLVNNKCEQINILNCIEYTDGKCSKCNPSHPILNNNECSNPYPEEILCQNYIFLSDRWTCIECKKDYYPIQYNKCTPITQQIDKCLVYSNNSICKKCETGYVFDPNNLKCISSNNFEPNCEEILDQVSCSVCEFGFYLENNECKECPNKEKCDFCDPENTSKCIVCKIGFQMDENNDCVQQITYYYFYIDLKNCLQILALLFIPMNFLNVRQNINFNFVNLLLLNQKM